MLQTKKYRNKPLYKKFLTLRTNVQYRKRLLLLKFKKKKWQKLIAFLQRTQNRRKKNFKIYDLNKYTLPKYYNPFKRKHKLILQNKKKLSLFYGSMSKKNLKKALTKTKKKQKLIITKLISYNTFFLQLFEKRLDVILYRAHFMPSIKSAQQLITHRHITINNKIVTTNSYILKKGDTLRVNKKLHNLIYYNITNSHVWPIPPKYLQINFTTFEIIFNGNIEYTNLSSQYPFKPDLFLLKHYNK